MPKARQAAKAAGWASGAGSRRTATLWFLQPAKVIAL